MDSVAIVTAYYEAWGEGNLDALDRLVAADFVGHDPASGPDFDREGLKQRLAVLHSVVPGFSVTSQSVVAQDDLVTFRWRSEATIGGEPVSWTGITIYRICDGAIAEFWNEWDNLRFLDAIGAVPESSRPAD
ncbi:MAG: ester cyclase [Solirubrobacterales bacterium]